MEHANLKVATKVMLYNKQGKILALEANSNGPMKDCYDLPGGRIDADEIMKPFAEILAREIEEELGNITYDLENRPLTALSWVWPNGEEVVFIYYKAVLTDGEIAISDEHLSAEWVEPTESELDKHFTTYHRQAFRNIKTPPA